MRLYDLQERKRTPMPPRVICWLVKIQRPGCSFGHPLASLNQVGHGASREAVDAGL